MTAQPPHRVRSVTFKEDLSTTYEIPKATAEQASTMYYESKDYNRFRDEALSEMTGTETTESNVLDLRMATSVRQPMSQQRFLTMDSERRGKIVQASELMKDLESSGLLQGESNHKSLTEQNEIESSGRAPSQRERRQGGDARRPRGPAGGRGRPQRSKVAIAGTLDTTALVEETGDCRNAAGRPSSRRERPRRAPGVSRGAPVIQTA